MAYVPPSFGNGDGNRDETVRLALERLAALLPGWQPDVPADPGAAIVTVGAEHVADVTTAARQHGLEIYADFGRTVLGVPQIAGTRATVRATATFSGGLVRSVPQGARFSYATEDGDVIFEAVSTATAISDQLTVAVDLVAVDEGEAANDVPAATPLVILDSVPYLTNVITSTISSDGVDPETAEAYVDRLSEVTGTLRFGVSHAGDAAILARSVPGVHRALARDGWKPSTGQTGLPLQIGLVALDELGLVVSAPIRAAVLAYLTRDDVRGYNVNIEFGAASYTPVAIAYVGQAEAGYDPAAVQSTIDDAVVRFLDPAFFSGGLMKPPVWRGDSVVKYLDVVGVVQRIPGLRSLTDLTLNGARVDVNLAGMAPLPSPFSGAGPLSTVSGVIS